MAVIWNSYGVHMAITIWTHHQNFSCQLQSLNDFCPSLPYIVWWDWLLHAVVHKTKLRHAQLIVHHDRYRMQHAHKHTLNTIKPKGWLIENLTKFLLIFVVASSNVLTPSLHLQQNNPVLISFSNPHW